MRNALKTKGRDFEARGLRGGDRLVESSESGERSREGGRDAAIVRTARHWCGVKTHNQW